MADLKIVPVLVAELSNDGNALLPKGAVGHKGASYRTVLAPAGTKVEVEIRVGGKVLSYDSWVSSPKVGFNSSVEVRVKAFDNCARETFRAVATGEEYL